MPREQFAALQAAEKKVKDEEKKVQAAEKKVKDEKKERERELKVRPVSGAPLCREPERSRSAA